MGKVARLSKSEIEKMAIDLRKGKSKEKKVAIKKIGKLIIKELSDELFESYCNLKKTNRNWEIQSQMILAMGRLRITKAIPIFQSIVEENKYEDMITIQASKALIRAKDLNSEETFKYIVELLNMGNKSVKNGAIDFLACSDIALKEENMKFLIKLVDEDEEFYEDLDNRQSLIATMFSWPKNISKPFFEKYRNDSRINQDVIRCAEKGKRYYSDY